jgi:beta-glucosidase
VSEVIERTFRCKIYRSHVNYLVEVSAEDSVDINGSVAWRFLIKFERPDGYRTRFDVTFVDFDEDQKRYQKGNAQVSNDLFTRHIGKS